MICQNCGKTTPNGSSFCFSCGAKVAQDSHHTATQSNEVICQNCGTQLTQGSGYCNSCDAESAWEVEPTQQLQQSENTSHNKSRPIMILFVIAIAVVVIALVMVMTPPSLEKATSPQKVATIFYEAWTERGADKLMSVLSNYAKCAINNYNSDFTDSEIKNILESKPKDDEKAIRNVNVEIIEVIYFPPGLASYDYLLSEYEELYTEKESIQLFAMVKSGLTVSGKYSDEYLGEPLSFEDELYCVKINNAWYFFR
ncbi:MAG: zinc ribbon domain-containing protein [Clostridiales bacterium]|jgi:uncharacterized membrane protein YvbJ|nr:zinc ribbon domain-containing protein [Clostridiales bacterium]